MGKKQKNVNLANDDKKLEQEKSVTSIVSEDKNNITNATLEAKKNVDSVVYADNLVPPSKKSKSIRSLNIEDKGENSNDANVDNNKEIKISTDEVKQDDVANNDNIDVINEDNDISTNTLIEDTPINDENNVIKDEKNKEENNKTIEGGNEQITKKSHKTLFIISSAILGIALLFFIFSTIFALIASHNATIINGVKIKGIDVSGLSREAAFEKVSAAFESKLSEPFTLKHSEYELEVFPEQFGISFDLENAVNIAFSKGRSGNIFQNNYEILSSMLLGININPGFSYNEEILDSLCSEMETNFSDRLIESNYYIENNNLIISKGKDGVVIDKNKLLSEIIYYINNLHINTPVIDIPVVQKIATVLDLQKIHDEVYRAPQDAYYTTNPYVVYPHVDGVDFAISMEEASKLFTESTDQCVIALKVLSPNVTTNQIGTEAFPDLLGTYSTTFSTSNVNRSTNIRLATQKINGTVIMPGETFSYNQVVGKRTAAAGFKSAAVYAGGEVTTGIGGGICQVSSTLYNSVLLANLEIVERYNHGFNPGYVPAGRDATVSWGGPDFKFKNSRNYPVKIVANVSGGKISIQIFGLKSDNEYEVEIQSYITSYIKYKTIQKNDATLAKGTTKVIQSGSNGCRAVAYRILKQNGEVISKTLLSQDTYNPHNKIVAVGTK